MSSGRTTAVLQGAISTMTTSVSSRLAFEVLAVPPLRQGRGSPIAS